jgi:hypothetical protein
MLKYNCKYLNILIHIFQESKLWNIKKTQIEMINKIDKYINNNKFPKWMNRNKKIRTSQKIYNIMW